MEEQIPHETRDRLGRIGLWLRLGLVPARTGRAVVERADELGYGSVWFGESPRNKEAFSHAAVLLGSSKRIVIATGIANVWTRDATAMANGAVTLGEAFPGRFLLGLGISHAPLVDPRGHDYRSPIQFMSSYLDAMDSVGYSGPAPALPVRRVLAALGPRMVELARSQADGAHPFLTVPDHTRDVRAALGPGKLLIPEQKVLLEADPGKARQIARKHLAFYLPLKNYQQSLRRQGFSDEDIAGGGSDRLVDRLVAWGDVQVIRDRVRQHLDAGADHVAVQPLAADGGVPLEQITELGPALLEC